MNERVVDRYYWADRFSRVSNNLAYFIGNKLCNGCSLPDALNKASEDIDNIKQRSALSNAAYIIKKGEDLRTAFNDYRLKLRQKDRFILSSSLSDRLKGIILRNWSESKYHGSNTLSYLMIVITTLIICHVVFSASVFVLPQFYEISLGMGVPINNFLKNVYANGSALLPLLLLGFGGSIVFLLILNFSIGNIKKTQEEADLLALLSSVKRSEQLAILDLVADARCFPRIWKILRRAVENMKSGEKPEDCFNNIGLSSYTEWFLNLSNYENDRIVLKEGAMLINEKIMLSSLSKIKFLEVIVVILQSIFFAFIAYTIFGTINAIVLGCFE